MLPPAEVMAKLKRAGPVIIGHRIISYPSPSLIQSGSSIRPMQIPRFILWA